MTPTQDQVNRFLDSLRRSGAINMFGAGPYVAEAFGLERHEANDYVKNWMQTFSDRMSRGEVTE